MPRLIALKPIGRYRPGDEFEVKNSDARVLKAIGKAKDVPPPDEREALLAEAEQRGVDIDRRWGAARLRETLAAAQAEPAHTAGALYHRRDMRAEDEA